MYRSDWGGRSLSTSKPRIAGYDRVFDPARTADLVWGDPAALGRAVADSIGAEDPPLHLLVGPTALRRVWTALAAQSAEIDRREAMSMADGGG